MKRVFFILCGVVIVLAGLVALKLNSTTSNSKTPLAGKLQVTVSFYPLYYFATQIGGQYVQVSNITPAAAEPHDYEPTTQDIAQIESGDLLILNGGVEAWGDKLKSILQGTNVTVVTAGEGLLSKQLTEDGVTGVDPHVWLDPILAKQEVHVIAQALETKDPAHQTYYQSQEQTLDTTLDQLDAEYRSGLAHCAQHDIITSHAAFGYLGERYGLQQVAIAGLSPDAEPSAQQLADVVTFAKAHNVKYIFFESLVSPKLAQTIAQEVGAQTLVLDPIEGVIPSDMQAGRDYTSIMRDNLKNLQLALQCTL